MKLGELTWSEVEAIPRSKIVLLPIGSFEQHGHHLPLLTDTLIARALADRVEAQRRDCVLLLPEFWLGYSAHHTGFPGTLSLGPMLFMEVFTRILRPLAELGFGKFLVLNGHGGNAAPVKRRTPTGIPAGRKSLAMKATT